MKILQVNVIANWGSTGRIVEEIGQLIMSICWESYIAYGRGKPTSQSRLIRIGSDWNMRCHAFQSRLLDNHGLASKQATQIFVEQIDDIKPDIIHLHNIHGYYLNYPLLFDFLSKAGIPVVWTLHDCWPFTGHCSHYSYTGCYRWRTLCHDCPQKGTYPSSWFADRSEHNYRDKSRAFTSVKNMTLVPVSEWLAKEVKQSFLKKYPIQVIYNGIDTDIFSPQQVSKAELGLDDRFMILGVASVWSSRKGFKDFIKLRERLPESEYMIVLVGLNDNQIKNLPKGIIGIKRTNNAQELAKYYSVANIYFNASVEETFGLTIAESLSCGTPAIVYNSTACPEVLSSDTGFVVEPNDIDAVVDIVKRVKGDKQKKTISICRDFAIRQYDKKKKYMEYINLYDNILQ